MALMLCVGLMGACGRDAETDLRQDSADANTEISFQGVLFSTPSDWHEAKPGCGEPADKTVVLGVHGGSCPVPMGDAPPASWVHLTAIYGQQFALGWEGSRTEWKGQTAWLNAESPTNGVTLRLSVPRLNVFIAVTAPTRGEADALLDRARPNLGKDLGVSAAADSVLIQSFAGTDGDGQVRSATVTTPSEVQRLLDDLRRLKLADAGTPACDGAWWPNTATLSVRQKDGTERTFAARFDECGQVVSGTGVAGVMSRELRDDVLRLVPNAGFTS